VRFTGALGAFANARNADNQAMEAVFTRLEARAYDEHCMRRLGIPGLALMERAVDGCARIARAMLGARDCATVVCGTGQNGGDGYGVAAALAETGHPVDVVESRGGADAKGDAATMRARAVAAGVRFHDIADRARCATPGLVVDGLFGTGLDRPLEGETLELVRWINACGAPVLAIDIPSGMHCDSGEPQPECVVASVTATMAARKRGFDAPGAALRTGRVEVVPIGGPDPAVFLASLRDR
jgi:NAD(P)H-hydrate epimerase